MTSRQLRLYVSLDDYRYLVEVASSRATYAPRLAARLLRWAIAQLREGRVTLAELGYDD